MAGMSAGRFGELEFSYVNHRIGCYLSQYGPATVAKPRDLMYVRNENTICLLDSKQKGSSAPLALPLQVDRAGTHANLREKTRYLMRERMLHGLTRDFSKTRRYLTRCSRAADTDENTGRFGRIDQLTGYLRRPSMKERMSHEDYKINSKVYTLASLDLSRLFLIPSLSAKL